MPYLGKEPARSPIDATDIPADSVTAAKIADDAIDSEHYTDGSIDNAHIADDAIDSEHYADGSIDNAHIADNAIDSEHYADGSIDNAHIADDQIDSEHYTDGSIDLAHMSSQSVDEDNLYISNSGSNGQFLSKQSGNSGGLTWAAAGADFDTAITINESGNDVDFRVESEDSTHMLYIDGGEEEGYVGISSQVTSPAVDNASGESAGGLQIKGADKQHASLSISCHSADTVPPNIRFMKSRNTTVGSTTIVADNDILGQISWHADDGNDHGTKAAEIRAMVDGTPGENDMPTELVFSTTADGAVAPTDHIIIKPDGGLRCTAGTGSGGGRYGFGVLNSATPLGKVHINYDGWNGVMGLHMSDVYGGSSDTWAIKFLRNSTTHVGDIRLYASSTNYNTSSDYRLKENVVDMTGAITRLKTLQPKRFNWIIDETNTVVDGFLAHEVSSIIPEAISGEKDAMVVETKYTEDDIETQGDNPTKEEGDPKTYSATDIEPQNIDQSKLVPLLVGALQEAVTKIEELTTRIETLEIE